MSSVAFVGRAFFCFLERNGKLRSRPRGVGGGGRNTPEQQLKTEQEEKQTEEDRERQDKGETWHVMERETCQKEIEGSRWM